MEFLAGFLGAVAALGLFLGGFALGNAWREQQRCETAQPLSDARRRHLAEEQAAWHFLHNYSVEDAYAAAPAPTQEDET